MKTLEKRVIQKPIYSIVDILIKLKFKAIFTKVNLVLLSTISIYVEKALMNETIYSIFQLRMINSRVKHRQNKRYEIIVK